ncbi:MAG: hypothetical protein WCT49_04555 [Candidatus Paceibacterota bacterium]|jgi:hypothetical protein|nr:hypothetical protein [Candidatus Paceibacterota bacterium]
MYLLITRPKHDSVTHYLYYWGGLLADEAKKKGLHVIDLEKKKATKKKLESYLKKQQPDTLIFNGHGAPDIITGHDNETLVDANANAEILKDKVVYMRSCESGKVLGPAAIRQGAKAFIGYTEPYQFWTQEDAVREPLKDQFAKPFLSTSNQVGISLIKGKTPKEAHSDSIAVYKKEIAQLLKSDSENAFLATTLMWNMRHQVCLTQK